MVPLSHDKFDFAGRAKRCVEKLTTVKTEAANAARTILRKLALEERVSDLVVYASTLRHGVRTSNELVLKSTHADFALLEAYIEDARQLVIRYGKRLRRVFANNNKRER